MGMGATNIVDPSLESNKGDQSKKITKPRRIPKTPQEEESMQNLNIKARQNVRTKRSEI
jgi:hypothetical protein